MSILRRPTAVGRVCVVFISEHSPSSFYKIMLQKPKAERIVVSPYIYIKVKHKKDKQVSMVFLAFTLLFSPLF